MNTVKTAETTTDKLISMMVGREMTERYSSVEKTCGDVVLEVNNLTAFDPEIINKKSVDNVSFTLRRGEILGIAGLMGSGRTELVTTIFGEYGIDKSGEIR